jgi:hypothetical protein
MHTETDEEVRAEERFKLRNVRLSYSSLRPPGNYDSSRGSIGDYMDAKRGCAEFREALKRQDIQFNLHYAQVETHCRATRPFKGQPYSAWLGILQGVWAKALKGELAKSSPGYAFHESGVRYQDLHKIQAIAQETTVKGKKVKTPKAVKPPKVTHNIIGVRFVRGHNVEKVYSYTVPKKTKLHLGEEVVVPSHFDGFEANSIAVVVALNHKPEYVGELKQVYGRITTVKA